MALVSHQPRVPICRHLFLRLRWTNARRSGHSGGGQFGRIFRAQHSNVCERPWRALAALIQCLSQLCHVCLPLLIKARTLADPVLSPVSIASPLSHDVCALGACHRPSAQLNPPAQAQRLGFPFRCSYYRHSFSRIVLSCFLFSNYNLSLIAMKRRLIRCCDFQQSPLWV